MKTFQSAKFWTIRFLQKLIETLIRFRKKMLSPIEMKFANVSQILQWPHLPDKKSDDKVSNVCLLGAQNWKSNIGDSVNIFVINQKTFNRDQATNQDFQRKTTTFVFQSLDRIFQYSSIDNTT